MSGVHLSVGERGVATMPGAVGSGVLGRLGRVQALAAIGVVAALTAGLLMGLPSLAGAVAGYGDVGEGTWYTDAVQWSTDNGIANIAGFCFGPDAPVSRGETAVWIYNMENQPDAGNSHSFTDVTDDSQNDAVSWMANTGITTGTSDTTFSPDDTLTRAQAAAFLHRLDGEPDAPAHSFADVVAGWQQGGVSWMADRGITIGTSETMFSPEDTLTRAQLITFLYRYKNKPEVTINTATPDCDAEPNPTPQGAFTAITAGYHHSCGIRTDGTAQCWGHNSFGRTDAPSDAFTAITAGLRHSCGLKTDGTAQCWGSNRNRSSRCAFRCVYRHHSRRSPFVWAQNRRHRPMLGHQPQRSNRCAFRCVYRHHSRLGTFVWAQNRRHRPMLGCQPRR